MTVYFTYLPGDSVQNIIGDVFSCGLGYILGTIFLAFELWWLSIVWALVSEVSITVILSIFTITIVLLRSSAYST